MKNKILLLSLSVLCAPLFARATAIQEPANEVIIKNGPRETYYNFPSYALNNRRHVRFILPENYVGAVSKNYPAVYLLGDIDAPPPPAAEDTIFIISQVKETDYADPQKFAEFINDELVLYTDVNYRTDKNPSLRTIQTSGSAGTLALAAWNRTDAFNKIFLYDASSAAVPSGPGPVLPANAYAYFEAYAPTAHALDAYFSAQGFKTCENLFYKITGMESDRPVKNSKFAFISNAKTLPLSGGAAELKAYFGPYNCIIKEADLRISPPVLSFDEESQTLSPIPGAPKGTVTVFFKNVKTKIKLKP